MSGRYAEPWKTCLEAPWRVIDRGGNVVCTTATSPDRIVACVNFCRNLPQSYVVGRVARIDAEAVETCRDAVSVTVEDKP